MTVFYSGNAMQDAMAKAQAEKDALNINDETAEVEISRDVMEPLLDKLIGTTDLFVDAWVSADGEVEPVSFLQKSFANQLCRTAHFGLTYAQKTRSDRAGKLQDMVRRFDGSEVADVKIQNMARFVQTLDGQCEFWGSLLDAAKAAYHRAVGEEWREPLDPNARTDSAKMTAAVAEAAALAAKFAPKQKDEEKAAKARQMADAEEALNRWREQAAG